MASLKLLLGFSVALFYLFGCDTTPYKEQKKNNEVGEEIAQAYLTMAHEKMSIQNYEGALEDFNKAIENDSTFSPAYSDRGEIHITLKNYEAAIKDLMRQCQPGSIVTFDEIKVKGPDNMVRTLPGVSYILY